MLRFVKMWIGKCERSHRLPSAVVPSASNDLKILPLEPTIACDFNSQRSCSTTLTRVARNGLYHPRIASCSPSIDETAIPMLSYASVDSSCLFAPKVLAAIGPSKVILSLQYFEDSLSNQVAVCSNQWVAAVGLGSISLQEEGSIFPRNERQDRSLLALGKRS